MRNTDHIAMRGFTALEVVFVLVVLGILSAVAVPRFFDSRNQMEVRECEFRMEMMRDKMDSLLRMEHEKTGLWLSKDDLTRELKAAFDPSGEHFAEPTPHYKLDPHEGNTFQLQCNRHHRDALFSMAMPDDNVTAPSYAPTFWIATLDNAQFDPEKALDFRLMLKDDDSNALSNPVKGENNTYTQSVLWSGKDDKENEISLSTHGSHASGEHKKIIASYADYENGFETTPEEYQAAKNNVRKLLGGYLPPSWRIVINDTNINLYWSDFNWNDIDNNYYDMENKIKYDHIQDETAEDYTEPDGKKSKEYVNTSTNEKRWITTMPVIWMRQEWTGSDFRNMKCYVCLASFINPAQKAPQTGMKTEALPINGRRILIAESSGKPYDQYYNKTDVPSDIKVAYVKSNVTGLQLATSAKASWADLMMFYEHEEAGVAAKKAAQDAYQAYKTLKDAWLGWRYMNYSGNYKANFFDKYVEDKTN